MGSLPDHLNRLVAEICLNTPFGSFDLFFGENVFNSTDPEPNSTAKVDLVSLIGIDPEAAWVQATSDGNVVYQEFEKRWRDTRAVDTVIVERLTEVDMFLDSDFADKYSTTMMVLTAGSVMADNADVKLETLDTARASKTAFHTCPVFCPVASVENFKDDKEQKTEAGSNARR
ncbi:MAG: hypothetical protein L6R36_008138 [Xanthoria steineri]|nr:MAG: hypothetical protein L6R36_008138 [Xanthoria steineri]